MDPLAMNERSIVVRLADGPCAGTHATVKGFGHECWQRLGRSDQVWCRYLKNLYRRGEYVWSGEAVTTAELQEKVAADKQNTYSSSEKP